MLLVEQNSKNKHQNLRVSTEIMNDGNKATQFVYINCADTLHNSFASHLSMEFRRRGIPAFVNCGDIEGASAYVVVFSTNYLSSTSCLDKLVRVLQCRRQNGQLLLPVFYDVSPSDVVVPQHNSADRITEWCSTLQELIELPGHQYREDCTECELVEEIVKDVYEELYPAESVGIDSKLLEIGNWLRNQTWGIHRIGIWGMPGIGKTTLAKAFFYQISGGYEASCFIKHFDRAFHEKGIYRLLMEHFGELLKKLPRVRKDKLSKKRTLVVLDDVHNPLAAESFLRGCHWFGAGSLIIITSRDKLVFRLCQVNYVYEVQSLNGYEARQLFFQSAFGRDIGEQDFLELSMKVIDYANGNPFALRFYGRELKGKKLSAMETKFLKLKLRIPYKLHDLIKSSYETLKKTEKNIFLDIACFFKGDNVDYVMQLLEGCGFFPHVGIGVLVEKCLVTISENRVKMHNIVQDFGREIINGETVQIERRHRLWEPWTVKFLLENDKLEANRDPKATYTRALGTENIEGIFMDTSNLIFDVKPNAFKNMFNLRFLKIYCSSYEKRFGLHLPKGLKSLPNELRLLHWENYPLKSLPQEFDPCHLIELNMPYSQLQKLWTGTKKVEMLKMVRLCHSQQLSEIDDICTAQNVELIDLHGCTKLQNFPTMCQLQHLRVVNLSGCREIKSFPEVSPNIEELHLQGTGITEFPISMMTLSQQAKLKQELSNLLTKFSGVSNAFNVEGLAKLVKVNSSNQHLSKLVCLNMKDCSHLQSLPNMVDLESLKVLNMSGCSELEHILGFPPNLKELYLASTAIKELPPLPESLEILNAHGCVSLNSVPFKLLPRYCTFSNCFSLSAGVASEYLQNALASVECTAREYQQETNKSLAFSFSIPSPAEENFPFHLQPGYSVLVRMSPSWRSTLVAFAILVEAAFSDDYLKATAFGFKCVCRWKDKEGISHRLEKTFHCWTPEEGVQKFQKEHMFIFCDLNLHPSTSTGKDSDILADVIIFEIFPVNKQMKLIDASCTVTRCGVYVLTSENGDASLSTCQPGLSLDRPKMLSADEVEEILRGLEEKVRTLFLFIACLVSDLEADLVAPLIASIGLGISTSFKVLADNSLICISTYGVIVQRYLLETMGREIVRRHLLHSPSIHSGELVGIKDQEADMSSLPSSISEEVKPAGIWGPSGEEEEIISSMVEAVDPPNGFREHGKGYYMIKQTLFEIDIKYVPIKPIGRGSGEVVCSAVNTKTKKKVAIRKISDVFQKRINAAQTLRDMNLLRHVKHNNIITLNDVMLSGHMKNFKDVYMVYELMDTDLHQIIKSSQSLSDHCCKYLLFQLLRGLKYLHSVNILHCDLKPENLLVNANGDLKISDFGLARTSICNDQFMTKPAVTHWYRAPEFLLGCNNYGTSDDIWSVGCIFAEILGRKPIFPGTALNQLTLIINVLGSQQESDLQFIDDLKTRKKMMSLKVLKGTHFSILYPEANPLAIDLLQRILVFDPTKRITVTEALLHPYMEGLFNSKYNPPARVPNTLDIDKNMEEHTLREMMWNEMLYYHPEATVFIARFGSSLCNIPDLSCLSVTGLSSSYSIDTSSYSKMSKGGCFMPMQKIDSASGAGDTERMPHSYKMHSSMCLELKNLVDRIMKIFPDLENARPGCSSWIQTLCLLHKALDKAKLLLQYCNESSKLYMAVTGDAILSRGSRAKQSLERSLTEIKSMVPTVLAIKISQIVKDLRSTVLTLESSEEEAGKAIREMMRRNTSISSDEIRDFHFAALKLQLSTPEAIVMERRSLNFLLAKLGECEVNKRQILKYLLCLLKKHERIICADHKENSFSHHQSSNDSLHAKAAEAECSEEHDATLPEQFKCPLSLTVMYDPVIISSGCTFERMWIQKWFDEGYASCPKSQRRLDDFTLEPNVAIKNEISKWCAKHGLDVQDPVTKHTNAFHNIDFSVSIASFGSSLYNIADLSSSSITDLSSSFSIDSSSYSKMSKGGYFMPMKKIDSASGAGDTDSASGAGDKDFSHSGIESDPLCGLTYLPWDAQIKVIEDVRRRYEHGTRDFRSMSPDKFLEPLITYLKNALERNGATGDNIKGGLDLLLAFVNGNRRAIESLEEDLFKMFSVFLESEVVAEDALNILEVLSNHPHGLSKISSSGSLSSLLKIAESGTEHLQEQAMITLKNLSSSREICLEMVSLNFIQKLTFFLQENFFCKHSMFIMRNLCNTEKGRVCITETPDCLASIAELLESNVSEEQENAISILLQLCVEKIEYCYLVVRQVTDIYSSLIFISNNGTEEAKVGASELLRALEEVDSNREEEFSRPEEETSRPEEETAASSLVVNPVSHPESIITTPSPKKSGLFGFSFSSLKKKKR